MLKRTKCGVVALAFALVLAACGSDPLASLEGDVAEVALAITSSPPNQDLNAATKAGRISVAASSSDPSKLVLMTEHTDPNAQTEHYVRWLYSSNGGISWSAPNSFPLGALSVPEPLSRIGNCSARYEFWGPRIVASSVNGKFIAAASANVRCGSGQAASNYPHDEPLVMMSTNSGQTWGQYHLLATPGTDSAKGVSFPLLSRVKGSSDDGIWAFWRNRTGQAFVRRFHYSGNSLLFDTAPTPINMSGGTDAAEAVDGFYARARVGDTSEYLHIAFAEVTPLSDAQPDDCKLVSQRWRYKRFKWPPMTEEQYTNLDTIDGWPTCVAGETEADKPEANGFAPVIAADDWGTWIVIAYQVNAPNGQAIRVRRSVNQGASFSTATFAPATNRDRWSPMFSNVIGNDLAMIFRTTEDDPVANYKVSIRAMYSSNGGASWSSAVQISDAAWAHNVLDESYDALVGTRVGANSTYHAVWRDQRYGQPSLPDAGYERFVP